MIELLARARARIVLGRISEGEDDANAALRAAHERGQLGLAAAAQLELGQAQYARGNMQGAVRLYREALLGAEATGESELGFEVRLALSRPLTEELERYDEGLWVLEEAEAIARRLSLPPERIAILLFRKASALEQAGRALEALPLAERSLALSRESHLPSSQLTPGLLALANLHSDLGHPALSSRYYQDYLTAEATSGLRVAEYAIPLSYSGEQLVMMGDFRGGLERLQQARAALSPIGGGAIQSVLVEAWISFAASSVGDLELSHAARARAELSQPHHLAELSQMLAWVDLYEGHLASSVKRSREALSALAPAAAENRAAVLENTLGLVEGLRRQGRFEDALQALEPAIATAAEKCPEYELGLAQARAVRAGLLRSLGRAPADAAEGLAAALRIEARDLGEENPDLSLTVLLVGREELAQGRTLAGLASLERALKLSALRPGDPWSLAEARFELARAMAADPSSAARVAELATAAQEALRPLPETTPLSGEVARWLHR